MTSASNESQAPICHNGGGERVGKKKTQGEGVDQRAMSRVFVTCV